MNIDLIRMHIAATKYNPDDFTPLFTLKTRKQIDETFKSVFSKFYGLNHAGLSKEWKEKYFCIMNEYRIEDQKNPYEKILKELYCIKRLKGDYALEASFVTKLVSFKNESYPIFDKYVSSYFGIDVPKSPDINFRIYRFTKNMMLLKSEYEEITQMDDFNSIRDQIEDRDPRLKEVHPNRLIDILIWVIGKNRITTASTG
jgi:hypothetical protein